MPEYTSKKLIIGEKYSRAVLGGFFDIPLDELMECYAFRPDKAHCRSIWLFVIEDEKSTLDEGTLCLHKPVDALDPFLSNDKENDLEILVFYQRLEQAQQDAGFVYQGIFSYDCHTVHGDKVEFIFQREACIRRTDYSCALPQGNVNLTTLQDLLNNSNEIAPFYFFLGLLDILQRSGASALNFVPLSLLSTNFFGNALAAHHIHNIAFEFDTSMLWALQKFDNDDARLSKGEFQTAMEEDARRTKCTAIASIAAQVLQKFLEPFGTPSSASAKLIFTEGKEAFAECGVPFWVSENDLFIQIHPHWITYLQDNFDILTYLFVLKIGTNSAFQDTDINVLVRKLFHLSKGWILKSLSTAKNSESLLKKVLKDTPVSESSPSQESELGFVKPVQPSPEKIGDVDSAVQADLKVPFAKVAEEPEDESEESPQKAVTPHTENCTNVVHTVTQLSDTNVAVEEVTEQTSVVDNSAVDTDQLRSRFKRLPVVNQLLFLSVLEAFSKWNKPSSIIPLSLISETFYHKLWLIVMKGFKIGDTDLIDTLEEIKPRPKENWKLYNRAFVSDVAGSIKRGLTLEQVGRVGDLGAELDSLFVMKSEAGSDKSSSVISVTGSYISIEDNDWLLYLFNNWRELRIWSATQLVSSLIALNTTRTKVAEAVFDLQQDLRDAVVESLQSEDPSLPGVQDDADVDQEFSAEAEELQFSLLKQEDTSSGDKAPDSYENGKSLENVEDESNVSDETTEAPSIERLEKLFEHTTTGYKYFLFWAVQSLVMHGRGNLRFDLKDILTEMLVVAGKLVSLNRDLSFGSQDKIQDDLAKLGIRAQRFAVGWTDEKELYLRASAVRNEDRLNRDILRYAPYLLIRPFLEDLLSGQLSGEDLNTRLAELSSETFHSRCLLYKIDRKENCLTIHAEWARFIVENRESVSSWFNAQFSDFLLRRNSHLSEICFDEQTEHEGDESGSPLQSISTVEPEIAFKAEELFESQSETPLLVEDRGVSLEAKENLQENIMYEQYRAAVGLKEDRPPSYLPDTSRKDEPHETVEGILFSGIRYDAGEFAIVQASLQILEQLKNKKCPVSLCEIGLSEQDYLWLKAWARTLDQKTASSFLTTHCYSTVNPEKDFTRREAIGALLFLLCCEVNRREGQEGIIWPLFLSLFDSALENTIHSTKFEGSPSGEAKRSIKAAIQRLNLRNVFHAEDHTQFLVSTFLQFGFTRYGIRNLPTWLARQNWIESIRQLLSDNSSNYSDTFYSFWRASALFSKKHITEKEYRNVLDDCAWIVKDWHDDLVLVLANPARRFSLPIPGSGLAIALKTSYVNGKFTWSPPSAPFFDVQLDIDNLGLNLNESYSVKVNGKIFKLVPTTDQTWKLSSAIKVPLEERELTVEVFGVGGRVVLSESCSLWEDIDVQVFELQSGKKLPEQAKLNTDRAYAVLASSDLVARPLPEIGQNFPSVERRVFLLQAGWSSDFRIFIDEDILWSADLGNGSVTRSFDSKTIVPFIEQKGLVAGEPIKIVFKGETENSRVEALRVKGVVEPIVWNGQRTETAKPVNLGSTAFQGAIPLTIKIRQNGQLLTKRVKLPVSVSGVASWNGVSWESILGDKLLAVDECKENRFQFKFKALEKTDLSDYALFEGDTLIQHFQKNAFKLDKVLGTGGSLELRKVFNSGVNTPNIHIVKSVVDSGVIASLDESSDSEMRIEFTRPIELSDKHQVVIWPDDCCPLLLEGEELRQDGDQAICFDRCTASNNVAVAFAFQGLCVGAKWASDFNTFLTSAQIHMKPLEISAYLAWIRWPVLQRENKGAIRNFISLHSIDTLCAWFNGDGLDSSLQGANDALFTTWQSIGPGWHHVIRELFADWSPASMQVGAITNVFSKLTGESLTDDAVSVASQTLWEVSPVMMAQYLLACFKYSDQNNTCIDKRRVLENAEADVLELETPLDSYGVKTEYARILTRCAQEFMVDSGFLSGESDKIVKAILEQDLDERKRSHLLALQSKRSGRQLLARSFIDYFKRQ